MIGRPAVLGRMATGSLIVSVLVALVALAGASLFVKLAAAPAPEVEIGGYATSLYGRTSSQRHNARLAAEELNGAVIAPGAVFSYNATVKSWSVDRGYVKAPVSFDGELIRAFGGGVCQTSTTLYNAALMAGLPILERHPHTFAAHYAPPGQDAAVAHPGIDLRFKNPYLWPIRVRSFAKNGRIEVRLYGAAKPRLEAQVVTKVLSSTQPTRLTRMVSSETDGGKGFVRSPGAAGGRVVAYRIFFEKGIEVRRERLSDDTYRAVDHVVQVDEAP
jgi:vancomycin resistance protein VanW